MELLIQEANEFCKTHSVLMNDLKDQLKKFCANKDEYQVKNKNYVVDLLDLHEK